MRYLITALLLLGCDLGPPRLHSSDNEIEDGSPDAGTKAPTPDAGTPPKIVVATLEWQRASGVMSCAVDNTKHYCTASASMTETAFINLAAQYPNCSFSGNTISCMNCTTLQSWCMLTTTSGRHKTTYNCTHLAYTGWDTCTWSPPAN